MFPEKYQVKMIFKSKVTRLRGATFSESGLQTREERSVQKTIGPQAGGLSRAAKAKMNRLVSLPSADRTPAPNKYPTSLRGLWIHCSSR